MAGVGDDVQAARQLPRGGGIAERPRLGDGRFAIGPAVDHECRRARLPHRLRVDAPHERDATDALLDCGLCDELRAGVLAEQHDPAGVNLESRGMTAHERQRVAHVGDGVPPSRRPAEPVVDGDPLVARFGDGLE